MVIEIALLGLLAFLWGGSYLLAKVALATIPPLTLVAMRVAIAALMLAALMQWRGERLPAQWGEWRTLFGQAFFNSIGSWTVLAWGQQYVDSALAGVLNSTSPIFVLLIGLLLKPREKVQGPKVAGAALGLVGVVLIVGVQALDGLGEESIAQLALLLGAALYAGAAIHGRRLSHLSPTVAAAGTMLWATLCLVPVSLIAERPWALRPSAESLAAAVALGLFCTAGALLLYFRLVRTLGPMGVASQSYLRAAVSVLLGMTVLGERLTIAVALGLAAIILGVAVINLKGARA